MAARAGSGRQAQDADDHELEERLGFPLLKDGIKSAWGWLMNLNAVRACTEFSICERLHPCMRAWPTRRDDVEQSVMLLQLLNDMI